MRLAHDDIRALGHAQSIRVVDDHMDRTHPYTAAGGAQARWTAAIANLLVERDRADPGRQTKMVVLGGGLSLTAMPATESPSRLVPAVSDTDLPAPETLL